MCGEELTLLARVVQQLQFGTKECVEERERERERERESWGEWEWEWEWCALCMID